MLDVVLMLDVVVRVHVVCPLQVSVTFCMVVPPEECVDDVDKQPDNHAAAGHAQMRIIARPSARWGARMLPRGLKRLCFGVYRPQGT